MEPENSTARTWSVDDSNHEEGVVEPINRRLTYTPPVQNAYQLPPSAAADTATELHGDDELAAALEAQMATITAASRVSIAEPLVPIIDSATDHIERAVARNEHETLDLQEAPSEESAEFVVEDFSPGSLLLSELLSPPTPSTRELGRDQPDSGELLVSTLIEAVPDRNESPRSSLATADDRVPRALPAHAEFVSEPIVPNRHSYRDTEPAGSTETTQRQGDESSITMPTSMDLGTTNSARVLWLRFASSACLIVVGLGGVFATLGLSLWQVVVAVFGGVFLSAIPVAIGSFVGGRSRIPATVISRATLGLVGDTPPAPVAVVSRVLWASALLWVAASAATALAIRGGFEVPGAVMQRGSVVVAGLFALLVVVFGFQAFSRVRCIVTIISFALVAVTVGLTWEHVDLARFLGVGGGSWTTVVGAGVVVFCVVGLLWVNSVGDRARYRQLGARRGSSGAWVTVAATIPVLVLTAQGALLGVSDPAVPVGLASDAEAILTHLAPPWLVLPLKLAIAGSLVAAAGITAYSGGRAAQSVAIHLSRRATGVIGLMIVTVGVIVIVAACEPSVALVVRDCGTTIVVPLAAWAGMRSAETLLRLRPLGGASLLQFPGRHAPRRWINTIGFVVVTVVGWGFTSSTVAWLSWQGYLSAAVGFDSTDVWTNAHVGVLIALGCSLFVPLIGGISTLRTREGATP